MTSEVVSLTSYSAPERRSRKDGESLVRRWRASGLSQAAFSRQEGIGSHVVAYWVKRVEPLAGDSSFYSLSPEDLASLENESTSKEAHTEPLSHPTIEAQIGDLIIRIPAKVGQETLANALHVLTTQAGRSR